MEEVVEKEFRTSAYCQVQNTERPEMGLQTTGKDTIILFFSCDDKKVFVSDLYILYLLGDYFASGICCGTASQYLSCCSVYTYFVTDFSLYLSQLYTEIWLNEKETFY